MRATIRRLCAVLVALVCGVSQVRADITSNLEGHWKFDDGTGTSAVDSSGSSRTITLTNTPTWTAPQIGTYSLNFASASSEYGSRSAWAAIQGTGAISTSIWFKTSSSSTQYLFGWGESAAGKCWRLSLESGVVWLRAVGGATGNWGSGYADGQWHNVVITKASAGQMQDVVCYVDGIVKTGTFAGGTTSINIGAVIGVYLAADPLTVGSFWNGDLDDFRIYSRQLSADDALNVFRTGAADLFTNLVAWYRFNEGTGTSVDDVSPNSYTLTLTNGPTFVTGPFSRLSGMDFDGTDDYGSSNAGDILRNGVSNDFTLAAWVNLDATGRNDLIVWKSSDGTDDVNLYTNAASTYLEMYVVIDSVGGIVTTGTSALSTSTWYHIAVTKYANTWTLYLNGSANGTPGTSTKTLANHSTPVIWLGSNHTAFSPLAANDLDGKLASVCIYNKALRPTDIAALYQYRGPTLAPTTILGRNHNLRIKQLTSTR